MAMIKPPLKVMEMDYSRLAGGENNFDPHSLIFEWGPKLIATARGMRNKHGRSYRDFLVGAASISIDGRAHKAASYVGANLKPNPETPKRCAEMKALGQARKDGFNYPAAIFIAASTDRKLIEEITGHSSATLHPCSPCSGLVHESTVIVSAGIDEDVYEVYTGKQLWDSYLPERPTLIEDNLVQDPEFIQFGSALATYSALTEYLHGMPEGATRMIRAEMAVKALHSVI